jgi:hypothetical protein
MPYGGYFGLNGKEVLQGNKTMIFDSSIEKLDGKRHKKSPFKNGLFIFVHF